MKREQPGKFYGPFASGLSAFIAVKRSLGMKYISTERTLQHFDRFTKERFPKAEDVSLTIVKAWTAEPPNLKASSLATRLTTLRQFCLYLRRIYPEAYVPDRHNAWSVWPKRVPRRKPYIFTTEEVRKLLRATLMLDPITYNPRRPQTYFNIFLLLYSTGMRVSEVVTLRLGDVDWSAGTLLVRESKFFKTRVVPVSADVMSSIKQYRDSHGRPIGRNIRSMPLFQRAHRRYYGVGTVEQMGTHLLRVCGLKPLSGREGPRLHDLRHTFAVHRISRWYAEGADVQNLLPMLATYMGHKDIASTQYYITVTNEILQSANQRFENLCAPKGRR